MKSYSQFFRTIYDEPGPVGHLGRGTHYSVLQYPAWVSSAGIAFETPRRHRFAVVWDEDHDERVVSVIEQAFLAGALSGINFVAERKGSLALLVQEEVRIHRRNAIQQVFEGCSSPDGDIWPIEMGYVGDTAALGVIHAPNDKVHTYLQNILNLWGLGLAPYAHPVDASAG
ncbi:MAG TPA: hypothetical protein VM074_11750 [Solimonas sp.]|nr:hypothetical protein [Solimonas sp.]